MKKIITLLLLTISLTALGQDKIYYDAKWNETTSADYVYYRPLPLKKVGDLLYIQDYFRDGQLQYQGYSYSDDENARVGDAYWYTEEGYDSSTTNYENITDTKELTYYYPDGKEWKKILYNNRGKKRLETVYIDGKTPIIGEYSNEGYFGTFIYRKFRDNYYYTKRNRNIDRDSISTKNQKKLLPNDIINYSELVYWSNGNKAKEVTYTKAQYNTKINTTFWDEKGNVLSQVEKNYNNPKGAATYEYYTKFGIAQSVKVKDENFSQDNKWRSQKTTYYPNGKAKEINRSNRENTEIYTYDKLGKENIQLLDKDRKPYDGFFTDTISNKVTYFQMVKGQKIGTIITKNVESDTIVAKGVFKDNKAYEGTFYNLDNKRMLSSYKDFLLDGKQTIFTNYYADIPEEMYEMKQGTRDGYKKTYKEGVLLTDEIYKNGVPINGTLIDDSTKKIYKNAELQSIEYYDTVYINNLDKPLYIAYFVNNQLDKVIYNAFHITSDPQQSYTGIYKNNKPYNGYFISEDIIIDKIHLIDYYVDGVLLYQYSFDLVEQSDLSHYIEYNRKSTFKNGKITDGYRYINNQDLVGILLVPHYVNSKIISIDINLFAMHFFKKIIYQLKDNEVIIQDFESPSYIKIMSNGEYLVPEIYDNNNNLVLNDNLIANDPTAKSRSTYYIEDDIVKSNMIKFTNKTYYTTDDQGEETEPISSTMTDMFYKFPRTSKMSTEEYFDSVIAIFDYLINPKEGSEEEEIIEKTTKMYSIFNTNTNELNAISYVLYDEQDKPIEGALITKTLAGYQVKFYVEGRLKKTATYKTVDEFKDHKLFKELQTIYSQNQY